MLVEEFENKLVTYTLELHGKLYVVEHVPARVSTLSGEQFFSPDTVDKIQRIIREGNPPTRVIETPVFEFAV